MRLKDITTRLFLTDKRLNQLISAKLSESAAGIDDDDYQYRPLSADVKRDLIPIKHTRHLDICYKLWLQNPLAKQLVRTIKNFAVGGGVTIVAGETKKLGEGRESRVQKIIDDFWSDPVMQWDLKLSQKVEALSVFGEQIYPVFVNTTSGKVRLGYIDPSAVSRVITNPENIEDPLAIKVRLKNGESKTLRIIRVDEDPESETYGRLVGDVFYFAVNKMPNSNRGYSDILANADWLDGYDQFLFNVVDRSVFLNMFIWDVLLEGYTEEQIQDWLRKHGKPKPSSIRAHNEKVQWNAVTPDLKSSDVAELFRILRTQNIGSMGFPLHWFGDGSDANLATAHEMGWPTFKMLEERQRFVKHMLSYIITFVIDQAVIHRGSLKEINNDKAIKDESFEIIFPDLTSRDVTKTAWAFQQIAQALAVYKMQGWISDKTAMKIMARAAMSFGVEIDVNEEWKKAQADAEREERKDYNTLDKENKENPQEKAEEEDKDKDE